MNYFIAGVLLLTFNLAHASDYQFKYFKLTKKFKQNHQKTLNDKDMSPLLEKVWDSVKDIGIRQINKITEDIIKYNLDFPLGAHNSPDVNWNRGVDGKISVKLGRRVEPTLDTDRWRVRDQLVISISASAFLRELRDEGEIEISKEALKLFAGVEFSRRYTYSHFATSYLKGLKADFLKLLFSFNYFRLTNFTTIEDGDIISKEDSISADINYSLSTPSMYFMAGYGKSSIYYSRLGSLTYHRPLPENRYGELDTIRMNHSISKLVGAGIQVGLQADFYELLNLTLLGAEYSINYTKTSTTNMTFGDRDLVEIKTDYNLESAFSKINRGKNPRKIEAVQVYITSQEEGNRVAEELNLFALMWGKHMGDSTEEIVIKNRYGLNYFYRHSEERVAVKKSWWDAIFNARNVNRYNSRMIENMAFEYQAYDPNVPFDEIYLNLPANLSFRMSKEYTAKKDKKKFRKIAKNLLTEFENLDGDIQGAIDHDEIRGPLNLDLNAQVSSEGVQYLLSSSQESREDAFSLICTGRIIDYENASSRQKKCFRILRDKFSIISHTYQTQNMVHVASLKKFLQKVSSYSRSFADLKALFHADHVQLYGVLQSATTYSKDKLFKTYFKEGEHQGHGVIKDFIRNIE